jgi:hypothetical protein
MGSLKYKNLSAVEMTHFLQPMILKARTYRFASSPCFSISHPFVPSVIKNMSHNLMLRTLIMYNQIEKHA